MSQKLTKVVGPPSTTVERSKAIELLYEHPQFPKNARLADIEEENGNWVATLKFADFPFSDDGGEGPDDKSKPPKKNENNFEGPNGDNSDEPIDEGPPGDDSDSSDSSDSDKGDKDKKGGEKADLEEVKTLLEGIATALGIPIPGAEGDSPIPGADGLDAPGPDQVPPPPGAGIPGGPPPGHGGHEGPPSQHALKPGEAPPGSTPVGAPAFASTQKENPFPEYIGRAQTFEVSDLTDAPLGTCIRELRSMVEPWGYYIHQCKASNTEEGNRRVAALIADHPPKLARKS